MTESDVRPRISTTELKRDLLAWYGRSSRTLPWRAPPGVEPDAYAVWLSEIMLQQTTVATVGPYFQRFLERWPSIEDLAAADRDDVLAAWAGLGYYARARNLHQCAREVAAAGGEFPQTLKDLRALPGIGPYTAAALGAIAFDLPVVPLDGNIERVMARLFAVRSPLPKAKPELGRLASRFADERRPGDVAQALMDLGALICTVRKPACADCPLAGACVAHEKGLTADLPRRAAKKKRPVRRTIAFWLERGDGAVLLRKRPDQGLLGGMLEVPSLPWQSGRIKPTEAAMSAPIEIEWRQLKGRVGHTFTHFHLEVSVWTGVTQNPADGIWLRPAEFGDHALPTLMRKIVEHVTESR